MSVTVDGNGMEGRTNGVVLGNQGEDGVGVLLVAWRDDLLIGHAWWLTLVGLVLEDGLVGMDDIVCLPLVQDTLVGAGLAARSRDGDSREGEDRSQDGELHRI